MRLYVTRRNRSALISAPAYLSLCFVHAYLLVFHVMAHFSVTVCTEFQCVSLTSFTDK